MTKEEAYKMAEKFLIRAYGSDNAEYVAIAMTAIANKDDWRIITSKPNLGIITPATKEQRDTLMKAMTDTGYTFDFENKELKKIEQKPTNADLKDIVDKEANSIWKEINTGGSHSIIDSFNQFYGICMQVAEAVVDYQKPAWSEEDIKALNRISVILVDASEVKNWWKEYRLIERDEMIRLTDFLKSLKDRYTWKPSDEQMEALESATENCAYSEYQDCLRELIEQLK